VPRRPPAGAAAAAAAANSLRCDTLFVDALELRGEDGETLVDTTGAGDAFCGAFCASFVAGFTLPACLQRASVAGTLGCTRVGARTGVPDAAVLARRFEEVRVRGNFGPESETDPEIRARMFSAPAAAWTRRGY
jgi:bifunctional ADP-heptose synthase (sugar kinase/adenylyltransferase)